MSDTRQSLADLGAITQGQEPSAPVAAGEAGEVAAPPANLNQIQAVLREQQLDKQGRAYATGRRKDAVARVWLKPGSGKITINGRDQETYFARPTLRLIINQVFDITDRKGDLGAVLGEDTGLHGPDPRTRSGDHCPGARQVADLGGCPCHESLRGCRGAGSR